MTFLVKEYTLKNHTLFKHNILFERYASVCYILFKRDQRKFRDILSKYTSLAETVTLGVYLRKKCKLIIYLKVEPLYIPHCSIVDTPLVRELRLSCTHT